MDVYPKVAKVAKSFLNTLRTGARAILGLFLSTETEDVKFNPPPKDILASRSLQFYLERYKKILSQDRDYPKEFSVDTMVTEIIHIYSLLSAPWVHGSKCSIQLTSTVSTTL